MIKVQIIGVKEAVQKLDLKNKEVLNKVSAAINTAALDVEGEVKQSIAGRRAEMRSVDTGRFMGSVTTTKRGELVSAVETNVEYAKFIEYGTSKLNPRYHFRNTAAREREKVINKVRQAVR